METKNLGLVKAIFRQSTSPVRLDVWWYDTVNNVLKSWDVTTLAWVEGSTGGGGASLEYTKVSIPANSYSDILIGALSETRAIIIEYAGVRGSTYIEGVGRSLIAGGDPYNVLTDEQGDVIGITYSVVESGASLMLRVTVDNSDAYAFLFSYRIEIKPKY